MSSSAQFFSLDRILAALDATETAIATAVGAGGFLAAWAAGAPPTLMLAGTLVAGGVAGVRLAGSGGAVSNGAAAGFCTLFLSVSTVGGLTLVGAVEGSAFAQSMPPRIKLLAFGLALLVLVPIGVVLGAFAAKFAASVAPGGRTDDRTTP